MCHLSLITYLISLLSIFLSTYIVVIVCTKESIFDILYTNLLIMDESTVHRYTMQQKLSFIMLVVFGILIVVLGFLQMRNTIYGPFVIRESDIALPENTSLFESEEARLQSIDTDQDGLNDYEELQFFTTSPYLPDTDSDGISDKKEIDTGTDPLCAEGQRCSASEVVVTTTSPGLVPVLGNATNIGQNPGEIAPPSVLENLNALSEDPKVLRELMLRSGAISKEELDKVDDATLLELAQSMIAQQYAPSQGVATTSTQ